MSLDLTLGEPSVPLSLPRPQRAGPDSTGSDPLLGRTLDGRYRVEQRIASGGMATVYRCLDTRLDRVVAVKVMHPELASDAAFTTRFIREAKSVARLSHPNVVSVFDQGDDRGTVFLVMEYVPGRTLREVLRDQGALGPLVALDTLALVLAGLGAAHRAGLVHRDVKPENVLLTEDGRVKLADFGLVRTVDGRTAATTGQVMGTVSYIAPEQIEQRAADPRSDVYACGVMLYEMLTGAKPHAGETPLQVLYRHVHEDVPAPSELMPGLVPELDEVTVAATSRLPDRRPLDALELLAALRRIRPAVVAARAAAAAAEDLTAIMPLVERTRVMPELDPVPPPGRLQGRSARGRNAAPRRRGRLPLPLLLPIAALVLLVAGLAWAWNGGLYRSVPGVAGRTQAAAVQLLQADGFTVSVTHDFSATVARGRVVGTDPGAGAHVRKGSRVTVEVSDGSKGTTVPVPSPGPTPGAVAVDLPNVVGETIDQATADLQDAGFAVQLDPDPVYSDSVDAGSVIAQSPSSLTAQPGATVTLTVSKGS